MPKTALSQADAAAMILRDAGRSMHRAQITEEILRRGLDVWSDAGPGRTPWESVGRALTQEIARRGAAARFAYERKGSGIFRLRDNAGHAPDPKPQRSKGTAIDVDLPDAMLKALDEEVRRLGITRKEFVHRALNRRLWELDQKRAEDEWAESYRSDPPSDEDLALVRSPKHLAEPWDPKV
jgi:hypothetical protein